MGHDIVDARHSSAPLCKGPEVALPNGMAFHDKDGKRRRSASVGGIPGGPSMGRSARFTSD